MVNSQCRILIQSSRTPASLEVYYSPPHLRFQGFPQFLTKSPRNGIVANPNFETHTGRKFGDMKD